MTASTINTRRFVDLHTHSLASDGQLSPAELIALADEENLAALALTDHDTVAGLTEASEAAQSTPHLAFIPGVEVSACSDIGTMHILALGIDETSPALANLCQQLRDARNERNPKIIAKLNRLGIDISMEEVLRIANARGDNDGNAVISRMHIAEVLRRKGFVRSISEAFDKHIAIGCNAYVDKEKLEPPEVISAIHQAGALAFIAHPALLACNNSSHFTDILRNLIRQGLDGIEVYHSSHSASKTRLYLDLARKFNLEISGGSDFHGQAKPNVKLGLPRVPLSIISEKIYS